MDSMDGFNGWIHGMDSMDGFIGCIQWMDSMDGFNEWNPLNPSFWEVSGRSLGGLLGGLWEVSGRSLGKSFWTQIIEKN
jgi:hypothetical protein